MSEFILSDGIDKNKIFLVDYSSLDNRYDPKFYHKNFTDNIDRIKNNNYSKLNDVIEFSSETWNQKDYFEDTFPYIEISKINTLTGIIEEIKKVEKYKAPSRAKMIVRNNDIIISTTRPDRGAISYVRTNNILIASTGFSILRDIKNNIITKKYLFYILKLPLVLQQFNQRSSGGNYPAITQEEISKVIIPTPPKQIQQNIVDIMDKAYLSKKQKELQAKELLESIDTYLLDELGITLPEVDNSLDKRIFEVKLSDVSGGRFDAPSNSQRFEFISKYDLENFDEIIFIDPSIGKIEDETLCTFLPMEKISDTYGEANISENKFYRDSKGYTKFKDNDLLWSKITPCMQNGKSAVVSNLKNNIGFGSTEYYVFRTISEKINIKYIHSFLRLDILKKEAMKFFSGSVGHQRVSKSFFKSLKIPLPPIEKQNEIAKHIQSIRDKAKQLKLEAVQELESAKAEVEKMILGL